MPGGQGYYRQTPYASPSDFVAGPPVLEGIAAGFEGAVQGAAAGMGVRGQERMMAEQEEKTKELANAFYDAMVKQGSDPTVARLGMMEILSLGPEKATFKFAKALQDPVRAKAEIEQIIGQTNLLKSQASNQEAAAEQTRTQTGLMPGESAARTGLMGAQTELAGAQADDVPKARNTANASVAASSENALLQLGVKMLEKADENGDGQITEEEIEKIFDREWAREVKENDERAKNRENPPAGRTADEFETPLGDEALYNRAKAATKRLAAVKNMFRQDDWSDVTKRPAPPKPAPPPVDPGPGGGAPADTSMGAPAAPAAPTAPGGGAPGGTFHGASSMDEVMNDPSVQQLRATDPAKYDALIRKAKEFFKVP